MMIRPLSIEVLDRATPFTFAGFDFEIERPTLADWVICRIVDQDPLPLALLDGHSNPDSWQVTPTNQLLPIRNHRTWEEAWTYTVSLPLP